MSSRIRQSLVLTTLLALLLALAGAAARSSLAAKPPNTTIAGTDVDATTIPLHLELFVGSSTAAAVSGYPGITVPTGYDAGLPIGITFIGRRWAEPKLLLADWGNLERGGGRRVRESKQRSNRVDPPSRRGAATPDRAAE